MYSITDYLKYYKDISIEKVHWNTMDNLMCAILIYLPVESIPTTISLKKLFEISNRYRKDNNSGIVKNAYEIINLAKDAKRYDNLTINNLVKIKNENTQFGACTIKVGRKTIVSYQGTDTSLIGWIENFRLGYEYPTYTQHLAINYLRSVIEQNDEVTVVGHSKGGNLAMASVMELDEACQNKIEHVYNFDGPGFRKNEYITEKYKRLKNKLINILPNESVIGVLLNNENYTVIKSREHAFRGHNPITWSIFGECFIKGGLSNISKQVHEATTKKIEELDQRKLKETFETIFKNLGKPYSSDFKLNFIDIKNIINNMKNVDPKITRYVNEMVDSMLGSNHN